MLQCLSFNTAPSATSSLPASPPTTPNHVSYSPVPEGNSASSSTQPSPTLNLSREYTLAVQTNSYNEMCSKIHVLQIQDNSWQVEIDNNDGGGGGSRHLVLSEVLHPNRECVEQVLHNSVNNKLTRLVSTYFDQSENTTNLCLQLYRNVYSARQLYATIYDLLAVFPLDSHTLTQPQCNRAFDVFVQFHQVDNPFPSPDSCDFHELRRCFSQLEQQLDHRPRKSRSRVRLPRRCAAVGAALCDIGRTVAVASRALVGIVATPLCTAAYLPRQFTKKEAGHLRLIDSARKDAYVLKRHLDTIVCLVVRLYTTIEDDKTLICMVLEMGNNKHPILEVMKELEKRRLNFIDQLKVLEEHICLCFNTVNRARSLLLQEIHIRQTWTA